MEIIPSDHSTRLDSLEWRKKGLSLRRIEKFHEFSIV